ncbi:MAG: acyl-ACP--UDP-N-acetylglucosamine O-acyltransferase [Candidatus Binatia bacterium]
MIHPTAIVDRTAEVDSTAEIGPFAVVEGAARIGARTRVLAHAVITGGAVLGEDNEVHYGAVLGHVPQDVAFAGGESGLRVGDRNVFREHCQVHRGTKPGTETVIGDGNYFMHNSHVAHNCRIGSDAIVAGGALLSGYVELGDRAFVSGNCVVHQFVRIGRLALLRGLSRTSRDVPPFCIMDGTHTVRTINLVGLRRAGYGAGEIRAIRDAFKTLFLRPRNLRRALAEVEAGEMTAAVRELVEFIRESKRGVCFGPREALVDDEGA